MISKTGVLPLKNWSATVQKLECNLSKTGVLPFKNWSADSQNMPMCLAIVWYSRKQSVYFGSQM